MALWEVLRINKSYILFFYKGLMLCSSGSLEKHAMACTDGVYLGLMRALSENAGVASAAEAMNRVTVVPCDAQE